MLLGRGDYPKAMINHTYYRALQTRDRRFDGRFFTAVRTTKIFCRPVCPAPTPKFENCQFFNSAAAALAAGFRPCLRCRPELSPDLTSYLTTASSVNRALRLIGAGALDDGTVEALAQRLGMGARHLRRLFIQHLGVTPVAVAQTRRILFAKQLIDETTLPITDIAMAAGFGSVRRFNTAIQTTYQKAPRELRKLQTPAPPAGQPPIQIKLPFDPPYAWDALVRFLQPRVTAGIETITPSAYRRSIALAGQQGVVEVRPLPDVPYLLAQIQFPEIGFLSQIVERLRQLFDLGANVGLIAAQLGTDPTLAPLVEALPGLRVPGCWDGFELAVRAILGQQ
ncbi:MAG: bifunctional transcriptional activator/DNA repair enzyme AdaA, partial [Elainella sp.]